MQELLFGVVQGRRDGFQLPVRCAAVLRAVCKLKLRCKYTQTESVKQASNGSD